MLGTSMLGTSVLDAAQAEQWRLQPARKSSVATFAMAAGSAGRFT